MERRKNFRSVLPRDLISWDLRIMKPRKVKNLKLVSKPEVRFEVRFAT